MEIQREVRLGHGDGREFDGIHQWLQSILESLPVGVLTLDAEWRILSFNRALERITGFDRSDVLGRPCYEVFRTPMCGGDCPMERALTCGETIYDREVSFLNTKRRRVISLVNAAPMYGPDGSVLGGLETLRDVGGMEWMSRDWVGGRVFGGIVGKSRVMREVFRRIEDVARTDTTVLILGESGTGKELVARAIHSRSARRGQPFVGVNCSALPEGVLESELFGHVRGAFTGAIRDKMGLFELADGGTLFLDEVGELTPAIQVKLLRVLEEREFQRVGDIRTIRVDIRLIAATNKDLGREVREGRFRDDLYYRLNVFPIELPSLRDRTEDLPLLVNHFIEKFNHQMGRRVRGISGEALNALYVYHWPGNVRELENAIEHAFVQSRGVLIQLRDLPPHIVHGRVDIECAEGGVRDEAMEAFERRLILRHLEEAHWRRRVAARRLGISPVTLWRKMKRLGIEP